MTTTPEERKKAALQKQIDDNLRRVYQQASEEKIPDRFLELLKQLRDQE